MSFPLIGNSSVKTALENAIKTDRMPHAIIIEGESGTGKSVLAEYIAKALLCDNGSKPCGVCRDCHLAQVGTHPDIYRVAPEEKKKNISVGQIRILRNEAFQKPQMADKRIFIIDKADTMNANSQNAILKVLEEPPGNVVFILLCFSKSSLLPTVISRCTVFSLNVPEEKLSVGLLKNTTNLSESEIVSALKSSRGNIGRALSFLDKGKKNDIESTAKAYLEAIMAENLYKMLHLTYPLEKDRVATGEFFSALGFLILSDIRKNISDSAKTNRLIKLYDITVQASEPLKTNINLSLLFTAVAYRYKDCL